MITDKMITDKKGKAHFIYSFLYLMLFSSVAFAQSNGPLTTADLSTNSFIRFRDNINLRFRSNDDLEQVTTVLGAGSVIQFPRGITIYNQDGSINFNETIEHWKRKANEDPAYYHYRPRYRNCPNGELECPGVDTAELYLPVRVVRASDANADLSGTNAYGYIALDYIERNIDPSRYQTVRTTLEQALAITDNSTSSDGAYTGDTNPDGVETTNNDPVDSGPDIQYPSANDQSVFNCENGTRSYSSGNYIATSCFARMGLSEKQRAELIMRDIMTINGQRQSFFTDPRFSACIAYRESTFSPNAYNSSSATGLYQVLNSTGREALGRNTPVTPGFGRYRNNYTDYRANMFRSTLAQADLHHSVLKTMVDYHTSNPSRQARFYRGRANESDYNWLAGRYYGRSGVYSRKIMACYRGMKRLYDASGRPNSGVTNNQVLNQLRKAK